ncbi:MAC/perforin domain-containing protein [Dysgonomonas sp. BGC7]|uniref:MAC/perforin domain-containing protein n=1 Tax=Dysgonomonas sp. BGC7 TaxID=1658008 RepID=UPI00068095BC|nr:MAC/perforin domain-containing protein [Dysgonomonas sp. BGC7]MBD8389027.1 hypothetical protein [Dysgonomonas sp. BGC7]
MKSVFSFLLLLLFAFASCSDDNGYQDPIPNLTPTPEPTNPYKTGKDLSSSKSVSWKNKGVEDNYFMLGYGFDATGKFAHPASVRNKIFDVDKYKADRDGAVTLFKVLSGSAEIIFIGTKAECLDRLASLGGFSKDESVKYKNLFKATFETAFINDISFPELDYSYSGYSSTAAIYLARFLYRQQTATKYLTEEFKADLQKLSPDEIIKKYGTHLLREVYVGQRIDYLYRANSSDLRILNSWSGYNAYYYFRIPTSGLTVYKPDVASPQKENLYIEAVDGTSSKPNAWMIDITNYQSEPIVFEGWGNITDETMVLVNFSDEALIPIYDLVEDTTKKEELRQAYEKYLKE